MRRAGLWTRTTHVVCGLTGAAMILGGCDSISIEASCPAELAVGESGAVAANELNPGAIPTYLWQVFPSEAGTFVDEDKPITEFQAAKEGEVVIRLTASDGLYQVVSACTTRIQGQIDDNVNDNDNGNGNDNANGNENVNDNGGGDGGGGRR